MAKCSQCQAPLPDGDLKCAYCGSRNDIDLNGIHYHTVHESDVQRTCPRCSVHLETIDLKREGRFLIERCGKCSGLFFDPNELETLLDATVNTVYEVNYKRLDAVGRQQTKYPVSYLKCPVCTQVMNRVNFGARSGVIVDRCNDHGVWLDGGELHQLMEWMKLGGKLLDQQRQDERTREKLKREEEQRLKLAGMPDVQHPFGIYTETLSQSDPDLLDIIVRAVRAFTR